ncbi:hypothetical protein OPQ81_005936 [Rhizoctonia solani]|nr:hypothetical protein OPQ81_005936 [Rhizoctonia solani]
MPGTGNSYQPLGPGTKFQWMPWHTRFRPRQFVTALSTLLLLFTFTSLFYWGDLELFAYPEQSTWSSNATDFEEIFIRESQLPQHNLSARYPEGRDGRFVRFSNQVWGLGWNNLLQERLLNTILAYESDRAPVFSPFEAWAHPPRDDKTPTGERKVLVIPSNALFSGPAAGAPWGPGDHHPRAISDKWWNVVCPLWKRKVIKADEIVEQIGKELDGVTVLNEWTSLLKDIPEKCVEIIGTQVFDFYLIGSTRLLPLWDRFSNHPVIQLLDDSEIVKAAVANNMPKLQALNGTFTGWNQLPQLLDKFDPPPRGDIEWGTNTPEIAEYYLKRCLPTPAQVASRLRAIRAENRHISRVFVATNAEERYLSELRVVLAADGWAPDAIITSEDLELNWQATSVAMAVDMAILSRAEVFVGNGFSSMTSNVVMRRLTSGMGSDSTRFW